MRPAVTRIRRHPHQPISAPHFPTAPPRRALPVLLVAFALGLAGHPAAGAAEPGGAGTADRQESPPHPASGIAPDAGSPRRPGAEPKGSPPGPPETAGGAAAGHQPIVIRRSRSRREPAGAERWIGALREELVPVLRALEAVDAARDRRPDQMVGVCRRLGGAVAAVDRGRLTPAPGLASGLYVERTLDQLGRAAAACTAGSFARTAHHLHQAHAVLGQLELALRHHRAAGRQASRRLP